MVNFSQKFPSKDDPQKKNFLHKNFIKINIKWFLWCKFYYPKILGEKSESTQMELYDLKKKKKIVMNQVDGTRM